MKCMTFFPVCALALLLSLIACQTDESALPEDALPINETEIVPITALALNRPSSIKDEPNDCPYEDCHQILPALSETYRLLANETCLTQWYCATCCLSGERVDVLAFEEPQGYGCLRPWGEEGLSMDASPLPVAVVPNYCVLNGATLCAVNPKKPGAPPFSQATFQVEWFQDGQALEQGALLADCICGLPVSVKVKNLLNGAEGEAVFFPPACSEE